VAQDVNRMKPRNTSRISFPPATPDSDGRFAWHSWLSWCGGGKRIFPPVRYGRRTDFRRRQTIGDRSAPSRRWKWAARFGLPRV